MPTEKEYFGDSYLFESQGNVTQCTLVKGEEPKYVVVLDKTIMYPQGGGQPSDTGRLIGENGTVFQVEFVSVDKETGDISHKGTFENDEGVFTLNSRVKISIDSNKRMLHTRLHSAGHLIDSALGAIGRSDLVSVKGNHSPELPFVEYIGKIPMEQREGLVAKLNEHIKDMLAANVDVTVELSEPAPGMIDPMRVVDVGGVTCPCGGTHVKQIGDIVGMTVLKIKAAKKNVKIYYTVEGNNISLETITSSFKNGSPLYYRIRPDPGQKKPTLK